MSDQVSSPALIAVDWGTSSFRAFLTTAGGVALDAIANPCGIFCLAPVDDI